MLKRLELTDQTSSSLLLRIRNPNDTPSWQTFQDIYEPIIRSYCFRQRLQDADVDDVVQEVLAVVARSIQTFVYQPEKGRFRSWLGTVTDNEIKSLAGKKANRPFAPYSTDALTIADPDSDWVAIFSERVFRVACENIQGLFEPKTWQVFEWTWIDQRAVSEVAEELQMTVHSVYVNKSRVLKRLQEEVRLLADDVSVSFSGKL